MLNISIIVPVYKVPLEYLRVCLDSLVAQTMQECEFIIVSDGAPEAECSICEEYAAKDSRFKFFKREHAGVSAARNFGIDQAQGEYITFVDADDWIESETCEITYNFAKDNKSEMVLFDYIPIGNSPYKQSNYSDKSICEISPNAINDILKETINLTNDKYVGAVSTMCKLVKRDLFILKDIQFPKGVSIAEDRIVSYLLFKIASRVSYLNRSFYIYNINQTSASNKFVSNIFPKSIKYLYIIKELDKDNSQIIANAAINVYLASWEKCYLNRYNPDSLLKRIIDVFSIVHSNDFQKLIRDANIKEYPQIIKQEVWLLKRKIAFPFLFHLIKFLLSKI
jgi:glycosyltransferase involved in cell wall biosynthesis